MENLASEIFQLVKIKMHEQGAYDRDAYDEVIDETLEYFKERGKMTNDENENLIRSELDGMFEYLTDKAADDEIDIVYNEY